MNSVRILTSWIFRSTLMIFSHLWSQAVSSLLVFWCVLKNAAPISLSLIYHPNSMCDEYKLWASHYTVSVGFDLAVWISVVSYLVASILAPYSSDDWGSRFLHNVGDHLQYSAVLSYNPEGDEPTGSQHPFLKRRGEFSSRCITGGPHYYSLSLAI